MDDLLKTKKDVELIIENEIQKFIDNSSASLMVFQNTYYPLNIVEINAFTNLMIRRYSHKVKMKAMINLENSTVNIMLEKI